MFSGMNLALVADSNKLSYITVDSRPPEVVA